MNNKVITVSISIVTFNHEKYIKDCLEGILMQQTTFPFEIILGEDESKDATREICKEYARRHPDIIKLFLRNRKDVIHINGTATGRYNFIENLTAASGKYIAICEGDDYWTDPLKLQKQVDFMEANPDYNICFHEVGVFNQTEGILQKNSITRKVAETTTIEELANGNYIHTPSVLFRNNFNLPKWFQESPTGDWTLYMIMAKDGKIKKLPGTMAVYRQHGNGVWSGKSQLSRMDMTLKSFKLVYNNVSMPPAAKQNLKERIRVLKKDRLVVKRKGSKIHQFKLKIRSLFKGLKRRLP
jgi:glycosyltransferase involved in cell wall biosynthesis